MPEEQAPAFHLRTEGHCPICQGPAVFESHHPWLRDFYRCTTCRSWPRQRAMVLLLDRMRPDWRKLKIHEGSPAIRWFAQSALDYTCSFFFPDVPPGQTHAQTGARCENFEQLTFPDDTFDIFMHQDVLEHVMHPLRAMHEAMRVLKPGGLHLFAMPRHRNLLCSEPRARVRNGQVEHLKAAEFHGDPKDPEGALVTWDYGVDVDMLLAAGGGHMLSVVTPRDRRYGLDGDFLDVFFTTKTPGTWLEMPERQKLLWRCEKVRSLMRDLQEVPPPGDPPLAPPARPSLTRRILDRARLRQQ